MKLSKRMRVTLQDAARKHGTHVLNSNLASYTLEKRGLVRIEYPYAYATEAGRLALAEDANERAKS